MRRGGLAVLLAAAAAAGCGDGGFDGFGPAQGGEEASSPVPAPPAVLASVEHEDTLNAADIEIGDGKVYVAELDDGVRIFDLETLREGKPFAMEDGADAVGVGDGVVWALTRKTATVQAFDPATLEQPGSTTRIGEEQFDPIRGLGFESMAALGGTGFALGPVELVSLVAERGRVARISPFIEPESVEFSELPIVATPTTVYAQSDEGIARYDPASLELVGEDLPIGRQEALAADGEIVYAMDEDGIVTRIARGQYTRFPGKEDQLEDPEAVAAGGGRVWIVGNGRALRFDARGRPTGEVLLPEGPTDDLGYVAAGAPDGSVVIGHRPYGRLWKVR